MTMLLIWTIALVVPLALGGLGYVLVGWLNRWEHALDVRDATDSWSRDWALRSEEQMEEARSRRAIARLRGLRGGE